MAAPKEPEKPVVMERFGKLHEMDRSFDIAYWQQQGGQAIFAAAWEMVVEAHRLKGETIDERVRTDTEHFRKRRGD